MSRQRLELTFKTRTWNGDVPFLIPLYGVHEPMLLAQRGRILGRLRACAEFPWAG